MSFEDLSFDNYCIICDRLIVQPLETVAAAPTVEKKNKATGTIRVKNPDGSTTTRTANGVKITRPAIRRNPASAARLAALANQNAKLHSLSRTKTNDSSDGSGSASGVGTGTSGTKTKSKSTGSTSATTVTTSPLSSPTSEQEPFKSEIYCSRECANTDAGRSSETYRDIARTLSLDIGVVGLNMAMCPPSPLFVSGSDTDSSASLRAGVVGSSGTSNSQCINATSSGESDPPPATSAPKTMEYFRMGRDESDNVWREYEREKERQRRSSLAGQPPSIAPLTTAGLAVFSTGAPHLAGVPGVPLMTRQRSTQSSTTYSLSGASSDSLASLWHDHGNDTQNVALTAAQQQAFQVHRTTSGGGAMRAMTPLHAATAANPSRDALGAGHRSTSFSSDGSSNGAGHSTGSNINAAYSLTRPIPRSSLSHTNLGGTSPQPPSAFPPEFGSVPSHTAALFHSYATAFHPREPSGLSLSASYRGTATNSPFPSGSMTPSSASSRRGSVNNASSVASAFGTSASASSFNMSSSSLSNGAGIQRPLSGTIRARPARHRDSISGSSGATTWDAFAKEEVIARSEKSKAYASRAKSSMDNYGVDQQRRDLAASVSSHVNSPRPNSTVPVTVPILSSGSLMGYDSTPKQSLEVENGRWKIKYNHRVDDDAHDDALADGSTSSSYTSGQGRSSRSMSIGGGRSRSRVSTTSSNDSDRLTKADSAMMPPPPLPHSHSVAAMAIPTSLNASSPSQLSTSTSTMGRTPRNQTHHHHGGHRSSPPMQMPDMTSLRLSSSNVATPSLGVTPAPGIRGFSRSSTTTTGAFSSSPTCATTATMVTSSALSPGPQSRLARSVPRPGVDWQGIGTKTYELPKGVVSNPSKGLFYFGS